MRRLCAGVAACAGLAASAARAQSPQTSTPEQFAAFIQNEVAENAKLIKLIGLKAE